MSAAELLLKRLVEQAGGGAEAGYVVVIDGEGLKDLPPQVPTPQPTYDRARTELGLRHLQWQARGARIIAVLPEELARRIRQAPYLLRRARNQRVHSLQVTDVLEVALGVRVGGRGAAVAPAARARPRRPAHRGDAAPHAALDGVRRAL